MLFNSIHFLLFFPIVTMLFFVLKHQYRWILLLAASCYFYMAFKPIYILILAFTIVIDYYAAIFIENSEGNKKKNWLIASLVANIGVLAMFKYYNYIFHFLPFSLFGANGQNIGIPFLTIALPIGLSFHTFQAMSYTIEVYRGNQKAERRFGLYSLYVMFYPQLVAGPIERPQNILPQFDIVQQFDFQRIRSGLHLMAWGLFKKVVIADRLAIFVDEVYGNIEKYDGISFYVASFMFSFQIYCDFSGYSDIAIGAALVMGFKLMKNFNNPYFATSISEFWRRWHISLSTWFRDYLYIPLGGNRKGKWRGYFNLFFVFVISGVWHGANTNYIYWGAIHGFYLIFGLVTINFRIQLMKILRLNRFPRFITFSNILITYLLVTFAWIFFRADFLQMRYSDILGKMFDFDAISQTAINRSYLATNVFLGQKPIEFFLAILFVLFLLIINALESKQNFSTRFNALSQPKRWVIYTLYVLVFLLFGVFESSSQFIYFQF